MAPTILLMPRPGWVTLLAIIAMLLSGTVWGGERPIGTFAFPATFQIKYGGSVDCVQALDTNVCLTRRPLKLPRVRGRIRESKLRDFHGALKRQPDFRATVDDLRASARQARLNGWGTIVLVWHYALQSVPDGTHQVLVAHSLLDVMGYDVAVEVARARGVPPRLLVGSSNDFLLPYFYPEEKGALFKDGVLHYPLFAEQPFDRRYDRSDAIDLGGLFGDGRVLDVFDGIQAYLRSHGRQERTLFRQLQFPFQGDRVIFQLEFEPVYAAYLASLPPLDLVGDRRYELEMLQFSSTARQSLRENLARYVDLSDRESVLRFVMAMTQRAFQYLDDDNYLGYEMSFPAEALLLESIEYSDCDDRAVFAAGLLRVLGFEVAILDYPDHWLVGVQPDQVEDYRTIMGYVPVEVTGTGYALGEIYEDLEGVVPVVHEL